ncbi:unnamed protein product [Malus baccata var. baccata]|uniref:Transmembrane protein n=1 Tax=Malus domestica TaxID=3750 RepID=A0A498JRR4_MALDO|nr:uncharacterized protein LOC126621647 [Malus sylvestris]RXH97607.1 hypothetical protein DVH24_009932 [Malus domestica]
MAYHGRSQTSSFLEGFSLSPLPYPVLLILAVISIFLGISWYSSYESAVEEAEEQFNWVLLLIPIVLILIVKGLSSMDPDWLFSMSPWDRRRRTHHIPSEGSSPWGVAAFIILLLVLLQYRSSFRDSWLI